MGRKNRTLSPLPASARIMTRLNKRLARSSGDICEMSGAGSREPGVAGAGPAPGSRLLAPRIATTVIRAPRAAPARAQGKPAFHPPAWAPATAAPHLWQNLAVAESCAPHV